MKNSNAESHVRNNNEVHDNVHGRDNDEAHEDEKVHRRDGTAWIAAAVGLYGGDAAISCRCIEARGGRVHRIGTG
ncbi:hypothetical protein D3C85_1777830 [compost metagenome]